MQTFLPYREFDKSAACLDMKRLGKQRSENMQIMMAILGYVMIKNPDGTGHFEVGPQPEWINKHWVTDLWRGHEWKLWEYHQAICAEWVSRGYEDTTAAKMEALVDGESLGITYPIWLGIPAFHLAYRGKLVAKKPGFYGEVWPTVEPAEDYCRTYTGVGSLYTEGINRRS